MTNETSDSQRVGPWELSEAVRINNELNNKSERATVLLAGTLLERAVVRRLAAKFAAGTKSIDEWREELHKRPQSHNCRRARELGLINECTANGIQALAAIRNRFAHDELPEPISREDLEAIYKAIDIRKDCEDLARLQYDAGSQEHREFIGACITLWRIASYDSGS
jgi:hypothetical protein